MEKRPSLAKLLAEGGVEREGSSHTLTNQLCTSHSSFSGKSKKKFERMYKEGA